MKVEHPSQLTLTRIEGDQPRQVWQFVDKTVIRVGTLVTDVVDVNLIEDASVDPTHCVLYLHEAQWHVRNVSHGGVTLRNGVSVTDEALTPGDVIQCGTTQLRVEWVLQQHSQLRTTVSHEASLSALRSLPGNLYAVLDTARDPEVLSLLRRSGYRYECLYMGWARDVFGEVAPYVVQLRKEGRLVEQLVARHSVLYIATPDGFSLVRKMLRRLLTAELPDGARALFRFYDPHVLETFSKLASASQTSQLTSGSGVVYAWVTVGNATVSQCNTWSPAVTTAHEARTSAP
jgi:Domain of unknown function (DUF4123)